MTHRTDAAWGRDVVGRWYALAERRLAHLTELFETGRWRRYYSEGVFLENIREAKAMLETWRDLTEGKAPLENPTINSLSLDHSEPPSSAGVSREQVSFLESRPAAIPDESPTSELAGVPEADQISLVQVSLPPQLVAQVSVAQESSGQDSLPTTAEDETHRPTPTAPPDLSTIHERYPLLRNSL